MDEDYIVIADKDVLRGLSCDGIIPTFVNEVDRELWDAVKTTVIIGMGQGSQVIAADLERPCESFTIASTRRDDRATFQATKRCVGSRRSIEGGRSGLVRAVSSGTP